jgi:hypothetical protein
MKSNILEALGAIVIIVGVATVAPAAAIIISGAAIAAVGYAMGDRK